MLLHHKSQRSNIFACDDHIIISSKSLDSEGFNETVVADLKYQKDSKQNTWVALSMVDTGTCWHVAILIKDGEPARTCG